MPKLERLKEELAIQKQLFFVFLVALLSITAWVVNSTDRHWALILCGVVAAMFSALFCYTRFRRMNQLLKEIEDV